MNLGGYHDMQVVRSHINGMKNPAANSAMFFDCRFDNAALRIGQDDGSLRHEAFCMLFERFAPSANPKDLVLDPALFIARQPRAMGTPGEVIGKRIGHLTFLPYGKHRTGH